MNAEVKSDDNDDSSLEASTSTNTSDTNTSDSSISSTIEIKS